MQFVDPSQLLFVSMALLGIAAFVQGYGGFGFGIVCMSLLVFTPIDLERGAALATMVSLPLIFILMHWSSARAKPRWKLVVVLFVGIMIGQPIGYAMLDTLSGQPIFQVVFGFTLIAFAVYGFRGRIRHALPSWSALPIGILSGVISGAFISGGPPLVIYLYSRVRDPREMKATVQALFLLGSAFRFVLVLFSEKGVDSNMVSTGLLCLLVVLPILWLAHWLSVKSSTLLFTRVVYALLGAAGLLVITRAWDLW